MTVSEFSNEFDILYNNINSNIAPGLNEYEKSVLLTEAQENLIKSLYNGHNVYQDSFEESEEIRSYLSGLVKTAELFPDATYTGLKLIDSSVVVKKPTDV